MIREVNVPPGASGLAVVWDAVNSAFDRADTTLAFLPQRDGTQLNTRIRDALAPDGPTDDLDGIAAIIATSGSTGAPRGVLFAADALTAFADGPRRQWIAALPLTSIGGINVVMRARQHDLAPIALPSLGGAGPFDATSLTAAIRRATAAQPAVALVPTQLAICLRDDDARAALRDCAAVLIGGARLPRILADDCATAGITVTATYGMTETAGGCVYNGSPLPGVTVQLESDGRIVINGPMLASGYRLDPDATQEAFTSIGFRTSDIGRWLPDGRLDVIGRIDDVVTILGVNVSTNAVEEAMSAVAGVNECAIAVSRIEGHTPELVAWVQSSGVDERVLRMAVADALGKAAVPKTIRFTDTLPHLPNGKIDRQALERDGNPG